MMRRVLVDHARAAASDKRGGGAKQVTLNTAALGVQRNKTIEVAALDEALERLAQFDPLEAQVVELRIFGGLELEEAAKVLDVAAITVRRDWKLALAWLRRELES